MLRTLFLAALVSITFATVALADADVEGSWRANLGHGVAINMKVSADGKWSSETLQQSKVMHRIQGTYTQQPSGNGTGTIIFTPTKSSGPSGSAEVENDTYEIAKGGKELRLTTEGDTLVFEKRQHH